MNKKRIALRQQRGNAIVEFTVILVLLMIVVLEVVIEEDGVIDDLELHETRYINSMSAP